MDGLDTFDDGDYTEGPMDEDTSTEVLDSEDGTFAEVEEQDEEKGTAKEEVDPDSQVNLLDEKEEKLGERKEKEDAPRAKDNKKEDEEDEQPEDKGDAGDTSGKDAEDIRTIKAFRDGKRYEIPEDATFKVKIDGKNEKVTLTELRDNYSGKIAYDEKFTKFSEERKGFESQREVYEQEIGLIRDHLGNIAGKVKSALEGNASPTDAMEYLLDLMGADTLQFNKAMYEHMADEFDLYSQMTEMERDAFWTKKENSYLSKKHESLLKQTTTAKAREESSRKLADLREAHGISEEDYLSAEQDLRAGGLEEFTPEQVIQAAKVAPLLDTGHRLIEPYLEQLTDEEANKLAVDIARTMLESPQVTESQVKRILAEQYEVEDIISEIDKRHSSKKPSPISNKQYKQNENELESFEDFNAW